jgi:hypothetical protein
VDGRIVPVEDVDAAAVEPVRLHQSRRHVGSPGPQRLR